MLTRSLRDFVTTRKRSAAHRSIGRNARASLAHGDEGNALLEMALIMPALLGLVTGICAFGITFSNQLTLTQAVGSAGQYLSQYRPLKKTDPCADTFTQLTNAAPNLNSANISMTISINGIQKSGNTCSGAQTNFGTGGVDVSVYATYPCSLAIYGVKLGSGCQLSAKVTENGY